MKDLITTICFSAMCLALCAFFVVKTMNEVRTYKKLYWEKLQAEIECNIAIDDYKNSEHWEILKQEQEEK